MSILLFLFALVRVSFAEELIRLAVLEFQTIGTIDKQVTAQISDQTRGAALQAFPAGTSSFLILTRENLLDTLKKDGTDPSCLDDSCVISLGRSLKSRFIVTGSIQVVSEKYVLSLEIYDTQSKDQLGATRISADNAIDLLQKTNDEAEPFIKRTLSPFNTIRKGVKKIGGKKDTWVPSIKKKVSKQRVFALDWPSDIPNPTGTISINGEEVCDTLPCARYVPMGSVKVSINISDCTPFSKTYTIKNHMSLTPSLECSYGYLSVETPEGSEVLWNGEKQWGMGSGIRRLPVGKGTITVVDQCHHGETKETEIRSLSVTKLRMGVGKKITTSVKVKTDDEEAMKQRVDILVDGAVIGNRYGTYEVPICAQEMVLNEGKYTQKKSLSLQENQPKTVSFSSGNFLQERERKKEEGIRKRKELTNYWKKRLTPTNHIYARGFFFSKSFEDSDGLLSIFDDSPIGGASITAQYAGHGIPILPGIRVSLFSFSPKTKEVTFINDDYEQDTESVNVTSGFLQIGFGYNISLDYLQFRPYFLWNWMSSAFGKDSTLLNGFGEIGMDIDLGFSIKFKKGGRGLLKNGGRGLITPLSFSVGFHIADDEYHSFWGVSPLLNYSITW